ncbi:MAG TPA: DsbA family protein [Acidimicrobiales bacterium]|nr:DsbA family protein [Acidimicrobiales bacterium]
MSERAFSVTYDYRCPFARNAHEHVVTALEAGADWEVEFSPFSLTQAHVEDGGTPVWDDPAKASHLLAIEAGLVVRDRYPERFLFTHQALFAARHDQGKDLLDEAVVAGVLTECGVDAEEVLAVVASGTPRKEFRTAHEASVANHHVFGVPTFVVGDRAVFVRLMTRPEGDGELAARTIGAVLDLIDGHPELNEFKHTTIPR